MDANLKARVLASAVLIPAALAAVLLLPSAWFACFLAAFVLSAAWEWSALVGARGTGWRAAYTISVGTALAVLWMWPAWGSVVLWLALLYWLLCCPLVAAVQSGRAARALHTPVARVGAGWLTLIPAWWGLTWIHSAFESGPVLVLLVLVLVWVADIGAYFSGRRYGRRKLASRISPGKTWEGVFGALAAVAVATALFLVLSPVPESRLGEFFALCMAVGVISIVGDLMESLFKRYAGVKDSGALIPGHGGVLDRVDSITAAAPCFALGLAVIEGMP